MIRQELEEMAKAAENVDIPDPEESVTVEGALRIIYALIAADGEVNAEEDEKFNLIGRELDSAFEEHVDRIISSFKEKTKEAEDPEEAPAEESAGEAEVPEEAPADDEEEEA